MPMSSATVDHSADFDVGPLSWVQGEIDQALARGLDALAAFPAAPGDATPLKHARTHVHQAAGAIQMVGLDAVVAVHRRDRARARGGSRAPIPRTLPSRATPSIAPVAGSRCSSREWCRARRFARCALLPEYEAMQRARGLKVVAASDLFFPDLSVRAPLRLAPDSSPAAAPTSHLVRQRRQFQQGLLAWLRGDVAGARAMREAVVGMEALTAQPNLRVVLVDGRRADGRDRCRRARIELRREAAGGAGSTCRSGAWSRARPRSPTGCGGKCSTTSRSARRSPPSCAKCSRSSGWRS